MWGIILNILKGTVLRQLFKLLIRKIMGNEKKGNKLFGALIKLLGKKSSKDALIANAIAAVDTNGDGKVTLEDFAKGKWKDIDWVKLAIAVIAVAGSIYYGIFQFSDLL